MKLHATFLFLHLLAVTIWVGGIFFSHVCLRPAAMEALEPPQRLALWQSIFVRFFRWVTIAILVILLSGFGMFFHSGSSPLPGAWHAMAATGLLMTAIFVSVLIGPYRQFHQAMAAGDMTAAAAAQGRIRPRIFINLLLGIATLAIATLSLAF
ncbi:MAG TPA: DUF4149 domain-containing protein [Rhodocyclaceae bacterium]|jgi:uncharacterized membrane protein